MIAKDKNKNYEQGRMFVIFFFGKKKMGKKAKRKKRKKYNKKYNAVRCLYLSV